MAMVWQWRDDGGGNGVAMVVAMARERVGNGMLRGR